MNTRIRLVGSMLAIGLLCLSGTAHALFDGGMNRDQILAEISSQLAHGSTLDVIARQTSAAGLEPLEVTTGLIAAGQYPAAVVTAMIAAFPQDQVSVAIAAVTAAPNQAGSILAAAITAAPQLRQTITTAVLVIPGVNPAAVLAATGSGTSVGGGSSPFLLPVYTLGAGNKGHGGHGNNCKNRRSKNCSASPA